jgi:magnesium transporter
MPETPAANDRLRTQIESIITLLNRQHIVTDAAVHESPHKRDLVESLTHRQTLGEVANRINALAPADIAHLLEMLPPDQRKTAWEQLSVVKAGDVLWEASDGVADALARDTSRERMLLICRNIDPADLAQIAEHVPEDVLHEHYMTLDPDAREWVKASVSYPENTVGHLMDHDEIAVDAGVSLKDVLKMLRRRGSLPDQTTGLFVVDERHRLVGVLRIRTLLLHRPREPVAELMETEAVRFSPLDKASAAARAFERYDLVAASVVGIAVPVTMNRLDRDPALGSSVLLTFSTDSMGFFIFLGLATVFLLSRGGEPAGRVSTFRPNRSADGAAGCACACGTPSDATRCRARRCPRRYRRPC